MMQFPRELPLDTARLVAVALGVEEVQEWAEMPTGGRRPTGNQARHEDTGHPLWNVGVMLSTPGGEAIGTCLVAVASVEKPVVMAGEVVQLDGLRATVWAGKSGLGGRMEATAVHSQAKARRPVEPVAAS